MNEMFDKLIIRIVLTLILCFILLLYKYAHYILYPAAKIQLKKRISPSQNPANTLHFFGRIIGVGILFSHLTVDLNLGQGYAILGLVLESLVSFVLYLGSIYLMESITLYNFEYFDEIIKRKNVCYSIISFTQTICIAYLLGIVLELAQKNILMIVFLWPFTITILGISTKSYKLISKLPFQKLILHKNISVAFSFSGHLLGISIILGNAMMDKIVTIEHYSILVIVKLILAMIIFPIVSIGIRMIFNLPKAHTLFGVIDKNMDNARNSAAILEKDLSVNFGHGIYEGSLVFASCLITTLITGNINFGDYYPSF